MYNTKNILLSSYTKEDILKEVSQEVLMEYYLGIPVTDKLVKNPLRRDEHPGCSFWKSPKSGILYFKDWAKDETINCFQVVMSKYNLDFRRALNKIILDLPKIKTFISTEDSYEYVSKPKLIQTSVKVWDIQELTYWKRYGINEDILIKYKVHPVKSVYVNKKLVMRSTYTNPIYCFEFKNNRIKVYRPLTKKDDKWLGSTKAEDIYGWTYIRNIKKGKLLFITSSGKDAMLLYSYGFPAIAPISEKVILSNEIMQKIKSTYKYIIVFMDNDEAGMQANLKYKQTFNLPYTFVPIQYKCKDISDFRFKYKSKKTYRLIKRLIIETLRTRQQNLPF